MDCHREILQQWIQIAAIQHRGHLAQKRIGSGNREQQEAETDDAQHPEHARREGLRKARGVSGDGERPEREHADPQQQRAFMRAPQRRHAIEQRQGRIGVLRDIGDREIILDESVYQRPTAIARNTNWPTTAEGTTAIQRGRSSPAPSSPKNAWAAAIAKARISAKWPSSTHIRDLLLR